MKKQYAPVSKGALACELGINPNTVSKAYKNLEAKNVIYTVAGKGVFVKGTESLTTFNKIATDEIKTALRDAKIPVLKNRGYRNC